MFRKGLELPYWEPLCWVDPTFDYGWGMLTIDDTTLFPEGPKILMWRGGGGTEIYLYDVYSDGITYYAAAPWALSSGAGAVYCPELKRLYLLRGNATADFASLDMQTMTWSTLTSAPWSIGSSGTTTGPNIPIVHPCRAIATVPNITYTDTGGTQRTTNHYIFVARGSGFSDFALYDITNNVWGTRASLPWTANTVSIVWTREWNPARIVAVRTGGTRDWAVYDISGNSWTSYTYGRTAQTIGVDWSSPVYTAGFNGKHWLIFQSGSAFFSLAIDIVNNIGITNVLPRYYGSPSVRYPRKNAEIVFIDCDGIRIPYIYIYSGSDRRSTFARCPLFYI